MSRKGFGKNCFVHCIATALAAAMFLFTVGCKEAPSEAVSGKVITPDGMAGGEGRAEGDTKADGANEHVTEPFAVIKEDLTGDGEPETINIFFEDTDAKILEEAAESGAEDAFLGPHFAITVTITDGTDANRTLYYRSFDMTDEGCGMLLFSYVGEEVYLAECSFSEKDGRGFYVMEVKQFAEDGALQGIDLVGTSFAISADEAIRQAIDGGTVVNREDVMPSLEAFADKWFGSSKVLVSVDKYAADYPDERPVYYSNSETGPAFDEVFASVADRYGRTYRLEKYENLLGYDSVYRLSFRDGYLPSSFYTDMAGNVLANTFGTEGVEIVDETAANDEAYKDFIADIDGDGDRELVANCMYGDGATTVRIYKRADDSVLMAESYDLMDEDYDDSHYGNKAARYLPKDNKIEIGYYLDGWSYKQYGMDNLPYKPVEPELY